MDKEQVAELMVRLTPEINKADQRFDPETLQLLIAVCEAGRLKWSDAVEALDAALKISFAERPPDDDQEPVIDPNAYGLTI